MVNISRIGKLKIMAGLTGSFFLVEIVVGYASGAVSLVADSFHMLSDLIAIIIGIIAIRLATRSKRTTYHTYGWERAEVLGALINGIFLLTLCFSIFVEAMDRFFEPKAIEQPWLVLYVGIIGLALNIGALFLFGHDHHGHSHGHDHGDHSHDHNHDHHDRDHDHDGHDYETKHEHVHEVSSEYHTFEPPFSPVSAYRSMSARVIESAKALSSHPSSSHNSNCSARDIDKHSHHDYEDHDHHHSEKNAKKSGHHHDHDMNMRGVFLHVLGDALGSVAVIIGATINIVFPWEYDPSRNWVLYIDPLVSIIIAGIICYVTIPLVKSASYILLQSAPAHIPVSTIKSRILNIPDVLGLHELHIWSLSQGKYVASVHILLDKRLRDEPGRESMDTLAGATRFMSISEEVRHIMHDFGIHSTTIQPEFIESGLEKYTQCIVKCVSLDCIDKQCCPIETAEVDEDSKEDDGIREIHIHDDSHSIHSHGSHV